jgi:hypothetical protein
MLATRPRHEIAQVVMATSISWLPLVLGSPHHVAYAAFVGLFIARFAAQPPAGIPLSRQRRLLLVALAWGAFASLAWVWIPLFLRWPA